ncbi:hypothetical protein RFI_22689 [Reticulomyxa filosa]|uniref:Uncharacterized protein n=1 Tax=Reticulomyxa filosa TaxID=46433 RepID=X6MLC3_RETFI|nr:hypothetical protein RFI_22689 [Reticulomyxa filosa]|eukprot:ETO14679.1 hypothetical protein RFI_22689 [Reticulomyxa filosa]
MDWKIIEIYLINTYVGLKRIQYLSIRQLESGYGDCGASKQVGSGVQTTSSLWHILQVFYTCIKFFCPPAFLSNYVHRKKFLNFDILNLKESRKYHIDSIWFSFVSLKKLITGINCKRQKGYVYRKEKKTIKKKKMRKKCRLNPMKPMRTHMAVILVIGSWEDVKFFGHKNEQRTLKFKKRRRKRGEKEDE